jgi:succinyl-CoA synthetase alpha subunit
VARKVVVRKNRYLDSVFLMAVARRIASQPGIRDASALLATEANRAVLAGMGYGAGDADFAAAGPNDLLLALEGDDAAVEAVAAGADAWLARDAGAAPGDASSAGGPHTIAEAVTRRPDASVAVISVPGVHAAREARAALRQGLHVFLFSSNVPVEDERSLKAEASERGLLVMGPDCGTAWLAGAGIGFANAVRRGPIGVVGSTGTGMQEFASLVHRSGSGISHGIGTGSRDLKDEIGGLSTLAAIDALEADAATEVVAVLSKPPGPATAARLVERLRRFPKPVVLCLLGAEAPRGGVSGGVWHASTVDEAVVLSLAAAGVEPPAFLVRLDPSAPHALQAQLARMRPEQRHVRGLFSGGTLCYQAQALFLRAGLVVDSNSPLHGMRELQASGQGRGDSLLDMGAEELVQGRPHPMIDATLRRGRLEEEGRDPSVALVLLDFILGAISSADPVGDLLPAIRGAQDAARGRGGHLCVVASVCGTEGDAQGLERQARALAEAGVLVFPSAAQAAGFCRDARLLLDARREAR